VGVIVQKTLQQIIKKNSSQEGEKNAPLLNCGPRQGKGGAISTPRCPQFIHTTDSANSWWLTPPDLQLLLYGYVAETFASRG
jgi:hypothetical protein